VLFLVPVIILEPVKPVGAYLIATGHLVSGISLIAIGATTNKAAKSWRVAVWPLRTVAGRVCHCHGRLCCSPENAWAFHGSLNQGINASIVGYEVKP
jgi:hypothetical protein